MFLPKSAFEEARKKSCFDLLVQFGYIPHKKGKHDVFKCPAADHPYRYPSQQYTLVVYPNNRWQCFACDQTFHGTKSAIDLYMTLNHTSELEAVEQMILMR